MRTVSKYYRRARFWAIVALGIVLMPFTCWFWKREHEAEEEDELEELT
jgi:hypothetical protein